LRERFALRRHGCRSLTADEAGKQRQPASSSRLAAVEEPLGIRVVALVCYPKERSQVGGLLRKAERIIGRMFDTEQTAY